MPRSKMTAAMGLSVLLLLLCPSVGWSQAPAAYSPERLRLARAIFEAQGGGANMTAAIQGVEKSMFDSLAQNINTTPQIRQAILDAMNQTMARLLPRLIDQSARIYAAEFDEQQLGDILAFYQSPTGRVLVGKLPDISRQSVQAMGKYMPQVQVSILEAMCAQTACPAPLQDRIATLKQSIPPDQLF